MYATSRRNTEQVDVCEHPGGEKVKICKKISRGKQSLHDVCCIENEQKFETVRCKDEVEKR